VDGQDHVRDLPQREHLDGGGGRGGDIVPALPLQGPIHGRGLHSFTFQLNVRLSVDQGVYLEVGWEVLTGCQGLVGGV